MYSNGLRKTAIPLSAILEKMSKKQKGERCFINGVLYKAIQKDDVLQLASGQHRHRCNLERVSIKWKEVIVMKGFNNTVQIVFAVLGGFFGWFLGGWDGFLYALVAFVAVDYLTGIMTALIEKKLSSEVGFRGIFKKVLIFMLVGIGHIIDVLIIGDGSVLRTAVIFFYISNEGISIIENAGRIGLPIPQKLKNVLEQLKTKGDKSQ